MFASQARAVMNTVDADVRYIGVPTDMYAAHGADYWDQFAEAIGFAVRHLARQ